MLEVPLMTSHQDQRKTQSFDLENSRAYSIFNVVYEGIKVCRTISPLMMMLGDVYVRHVCPLVDDSGTVPVNFFLFLLEKKD